MKDQNWQELGLLQNVEVHEGWRSRAVNMMRGRPEKDRRGYKRLEY